MKGYSAKVEFTSKELTQKEKIKIKDTSNCLSLNTLTGTGSVTIDIDYYAIISVHNELTKKGNVDFIQTVIVDKDGTKYITGSELLLSALEDITADMNGCDEPYQIEVYKKESKNYSGKGFLTCSII